MTQQIELSYLVEHCTQLPTYKDALPLITLIQEWGAVHGAVAQAMEAINQIRDHFRPLMPKAPESEPKSLPMIDTPELPELKFFYQVSTQQFSDFKEALRNCLSKIDMYGKKEWFCIYAAWRFVCKERERAGGYVDFFVDINTLFPGLPICCRMNTRSGLSTATTCPPCRSGLIATCWRGMATISKQ